MPIIVLPIQNPYHSIDRVCVEQVVNQLISDDVILGYDRMIHKDRIKQPKKNGSDPSDKRPDKKRAYNSGEVLLEVSPTYSYQPQNDWAHNEQWRFTDPLFKDVDTHSFIYPVYLDQDVSIELKYTVDSLEMLRQLEGKLRMLFTMGYTGTDHQLKYSVIYDKFVDEWLGEIHTRREGRAPYGETYEDYVLKHSQNSLSVIRSANRDEPAFSAIENRIEGDLKRGGLDIVDEGDGIFSLTVTYTYSHSRVMATILSFPVIVHQQPMPYNYVLERNNETGSDHVVSNNGIFLAYERDIRHIRKAVNVPIVDKWTVPLTSHPQWYVPLFTALISLEAGSTTLLDLENMDDMKLHPEILTFLEGFTGEVGVPYKSPFLVTLYRENSRLHPKYVSVKGLKVERTTELNERGVYRVVFSLLSDLSGLSSGSLAVLNKSSAKGLIVDCINQTRHQSLKQVSGINEVLVEADLSCPTYVRVRGTLVESYKEYSDAIIRGRHRNLSGLVSVRRIMSVGIHTKK